MNTTLLGNFTVPSKTGVIIINETFHAINLFEIILAIGGYLLLVFFYIRVNKEKEKYSNWVNPKGRKINLVKLLKFYVILYPITIVLLAALQIWLFMK